MHLVLTGGGTAGHIVPNVALIQELRQRYPDNLELLYIGSRQSMEEQMMKDLNVSFRAVFSGKLRRYFSWKNFVDMVKVPIGVLQSIAVMRKFRPKAVFSKGGFVSFPVVLAAWFLRIPVVLHESDLVPGLANKMASRFAQKVCVSFQESRKYFSGKKVVVTGALVRRSMRDGDEAEAREFTGLKGVKPVVLVLGGSQGSRFLNDLVWNNLDRLLKDYQVVHICGRGKIQEIHEEGYKAFGYVKDEMKDLYALADVVVSRSGANTLAEIAVLGKPSILIPLSKKVSRGDQISNAHSHAKKHTAHVMEEHDFDPHVFFEKLEDFAGKVESHMDEHDFMAAEKIITLLEEL